MILLFLFCAFRSGSDRYYLKIAKSVHADGRDVLFYFRLKNIPSLLRFLLNYYLRKALVFLLCFLPCVLNTAGVLYFLNNRSMSYAVFTLSLLTAFLLLINGIIFFVRFNSLFFTARYCFALGKCVSYGKLFDFALRSMNGKRREVFVKKLSFIPWFLCCVFLLPVSFVRSYYNLTMAQTAADIIELQYLQNR